MNPDEKRVMLKKIVLTLVLCMPPLLALAEPENYIILFDCTASMKGSDGGPVVWEDAKSILTDAVFSINGDEAKIIVIPFQDKVGNVVEFYASDGSKASKLNSILADVDRMISSPHRGTSICRAWDRGLKYLEEDCFNFMLLLTDGADNINLSTGNPAKLDRYGKPVTPADATILDECTEEVCCRIRKWCEFGPNKIMSYSRLTQGAQVAKITEAAKNCRNIDFSDGLNLSLLSTREIVFNVSDFRTVNQLSVPLKLNNSLSGKATVKSNNDLFDLFLQKEGFINGSATLVIKPKLGYQELRERVGQQVNVIAQIESANQKDLNILLNEVELKVIGSPEKVLSVKLDRTDLGRALHYRKFLWKKASTPDTLHTKLSFDFNDYAEDASSRAVFNICSDADEYCEFYVNGEKASSFIVNADSDVEVGVVFNPDAPEAYYGVQVISADTELDRIDNVSIESGEIWKTQFFGKYRIRTNPLKIALIVILLSVFALFLLWTCVLRYIFFPRFKISLIFAGPDEKFMVQKRVKGFIRFVITSSSKRQSGIMNLFTGKVQYLQMSREDGVIEDIVIEPFDKRSVRICKSPKGSYLITYPRLKINKVGQPSDTSEVINQQYKKSIKIKIQ